jgi:hypothetical protein
MVGLMGVGVNSAEFHAEEKLFPQPAEANAFLQRL